MRSGGPGRAITRLAWQAIAAALLMVCLPSADAWAASKACRQLEAQLASLPAGGGGASQAKRYDRAIVRQQQQIGKARDQARQAGCGRAIFGRSIAVCASLNGTLERMQANLVDLQRKRGQIGNRGGKQERARIMAAIDVNGCRAPKRKLPPPVEDGKRVQAVIDGRTGLRIDPPRGRFRTLCVRTCDGYYFPISWSVDQTAFERDQKACSAMCPGADVEMHYHRVPGEESEDMVSAATGLPYRDMPNAFLYRQTNMRQPEGCGCARGTTAERGFEVIAGEHPGAVVDEEQAEQTAAVPPMPGAAGEAGAQSSIETWQDIGAAMRPTLPGKLPAPAEQFAQDPNREVRVVGPKFLPDPEEAIDLQAPDPNRVR